MCIIISVNNKKGLFREMNFLEFKKKVIGFPVFSTSHLNSLGENRQVLRNQLTKWQKKGLVIKLKKGLYILNEIDRKITPSRTFLANQLYEPSYISTEYALGFYDLIPERVADVTSVSPKKTMMFENKFGRFIYQRVKITCFTGYRILQDENGLNYFIAEPEKALVDFTYLNRSLFGNKDKEIFESLRLQNVESLSVKKIIKYAKTFKNYRFMDIIKLLVKFIKEV